MATLTNNNSYLELQDTLISMLQTLAEDELNHWLRLTKTVLSTSDSSASNGKNAGVGGGGGGLGSGGGGKSLAEKTSKDDDNDDDDDDEDGDDDVKFDASEEPKSHPTVAPRWPTRIFTIGRVGVNS